jgi:hypothetical protein
MEHVKEVNTPISTSSKLDMDKDSENLNITKYRGMIDSLLYLIASRPDIIFCVCLCACFQTCPKESHVTVVKHIFCYLHDTIDLGLWYPKVSELSSISYSNDDFTRCKIDRKRTSETCYFLGSSLVLWASKKHNSLTLLTIEAEYIVVASRCTQIL